MNLVREIRYLFDRKLKLKTLAMVLIILLGSVAELLGVAVIVPIIQLATEPDMILTNRYCLWVMKLTGFTDAQQILLSFIVLTILLYILKNLYLAWMIYMMNRFAKNTKMQFSTRLMEAYMKQPYAYFLNKNTAEILRSVMNDTNNLYTVISNLQQMISQGTTAFLIILFLFIMNPVMTLVILIVLGGSSLLIVFGVQRKMRRLGKQYQRASVKIVQSVKQSFEGIKEVKIMNKEHFFISDFRTVFRRSNQIELVYNLLSSIPKYIIETICIGGIMGYLGVSIMIGGNMARMLPQLSAFAVGAFKLLPSINTLYASFSNILYNKVSIDLIYRDIRQVEHVSNDCITDKEVAPLSFEKEIMVNHVSFRYDNTEHDIFSDVSVCIQKGESVAFVGESGSGKTTLVDVILGILIPREGTILVDGKNIMNILESWHRGIGYIPQMIFLLDDSIRKNVAFGIPDDKINDDAVWEALKLAKLEEFVRGLPQGLDTEVGEAGTRLSGGQRQRLGIARALYTAPDILVFDEATSALDMETEKELMEAINGLHGMKTMIMIAHRLSTIEKCDHVYKVGEQTIEQMR